MKYYFKQVSYKPGIWNTDNKNQPKKAKNVIFYVKYFLSNENTVYREKCLLLKSTIKIVFKLL